MEIEERDEPRRSAVTKKAATKPKTDIAADEAKEDAKPKRVTVRARDASQWKGLLKEAKAKHWRKLKVVIKIHDKLLAGKPASLNAADAMLKARGLEAFVATADDITDPTQLAEMAARVSKDEGLCEFNRREGHPGVWIPSNNLKAGLKENWSVLGLRVKVRGSRGALAEGVFVVGEGEGPEADWIRVGDAPDGIAQQVAHTTGPSGPVSSIKRHEYMQSPTLTFIIMMANAEAVSDKISDDELASVFEHWASHGTGAGRSQGNGKFDIISIEEIVQ
jgi:hypothetical protein